MVIKALSPLKCFGSERGLFFSVTKSNSKRCLCIPLCLNVKTNQPNHAFWSTCSLCYFPIIVYQLARLFTFLSLAGLTLSIQFSPFSWKHKYKSHINQQVINLAGNLKMNAGTRQKIDIRVNLGDVWKLGNKMSLQGEVKIEARHSLGGKF